MTPASQRATALLHRPKQRQKRWAPKVKTGCAGCRVRRIKCGEEKPICKRCASFGRVCDYPLLPQHNLLLAEPLTSVSPPGVASTSAELELNYYFRTQFITKCTDEFNGALWHLHVPQASQSQVPIWHACNFVATLHRLQMMQPSRMAIDQGVVEKMNREGLRQYSAALNSIIKLTNQPILSTRDKSLILVVNLIFQMALPWRSDIADSFNIHKNSMRLVRYWKFWGNESSFALLPSTLILLYFIKTERTMQESLLVTSKSAWHWDKALKSLQERPFQICADACLELEMLWIGLQAVIQNLPFRPSPRELSIANTARYAFRWRFEKWIARFQEFQCSPYATRADRGRVIILKIRQILVGVLLKVDISNMEICWDEFNGEFSKATALVEFVLSKDFKDSGLPLFTPMLAKMLHFMAKACRTPILRRKMITLLQLQLETAVSLVTAKRKHFSYTQVIDAIVNVEEGAWIQGGKESCQCLPCCVPGEFICNNHRVIEVHVNIKPDETKDLTLRTTGDVLNNRSGQLLPVVAATWS